MTDLIKKEDFHPSFTDLEIEALNKHLTLGGPTIAASTAANFLTLYLEGRSMEQIKRQFPQWPYGALLHARHTYLWDKHKEDYVHDLMNQFKDRLVKSKLDVVNHVMDTLAVAHKEFARDMELYLQNPKPENLPKNRIKSHKEYREVLKTLQEGISLGQQQDSGSKGGQPTVNITAGPGTTIKISSEKHEEVLDALLEAKKE